MTPGSLLLGNPDHAFECSHEHGTGDTVAGIGGIDLGLERAGMRCIGQVEIEPYRRAVLAHHWPNVPRWDDVRTFKKEYLSERPDLICGGFPCQDISNAGARAGIGGERSGSWSNSTSTSHSLRR